MSDFFDPLQEAAREAIAAAEQLAITSPEQPERSRRVDDAEQQLPRLRHAIERRLALGLAVPLTEPLPDGREGWEHEVRAALQDLGRDAEALVEAATAVPAPPETGPGGEWTAAADEQDRARFRALQKVWRIADRLRQLALGLSHLACRVDTAAPAGVPPDRPVAAPNPFHFSDDFRSCRWGGETYEFTATQAAVVKQLWDAWKAGTPVLGQELLLERAGSSMGQGPDSKPRLAKLFADNPAWGTLIVAGATKGTFRLADPPG
jgi:hypothetical protein